MLMLQCLYAGIGPRVAPHHILLTSIQHECCKLVVEYHSSGIASLRGVRSNGACTHHSGVHNHILCQTPASQSGSTAQCMCCRDARFCLMSSASLSPATHHLRYLAQLAASRYRTGDATRQATLMDLQQPSFSCTDNTPLTDTTELVKALTPY
eukprot:GHUV01029507.1.p1 GENE.GHUV01029507.1~~GHUV01029507.1.p1  ORF type:complete len:153 (+),score=18.38 GHUV01029507.1:388-846(+)